MCFVFRIDGQIKTVTRDMSVLKNVSIKLEGSPETEVWVALLKTAVAFNSLNPFYDGFYYKNEIVISNMDRNQLRLQLRVAKHVILKFGSQETMEEFCKIAK
jgi:hypothetical protein